LARLASRSSKADWDEVKQSIEKFGLESRMFREIFVKSFGSGQSDPFQIQFANDGPKVNIVDLGYGTSQVLPVLFEIARKPRGTNFLIQQPEVHLHPKAQAALATYFVSALTSRKSNFVLETHSDFIVDRIRLAVRSGLIGAGDVSILYFSRGRLENSIAEVTIDETGEIQGAPDGYRDFFHNEQLSLLGVE
jgi:predicted ATPase